MILKSVQLKMQSFSVNKRKSFSTLGSRMALKIQSKNCWTCWKKNVGEWFANSFSTST